MALEPIYEIEFHDSSYGFRPNRNTHHAIFRCQQMMHRGFTRVIEGDVKACFDEISHKAILGCLREKVMDNKFLELIRRLLKAGVSFRGVVRPTEKGVPQGGVASPLLANVVLNKLDWFLHQKGHHGEATNRISRKGQPNIRFARYADDWCVFITRGSKSFAERLRDQIRKFLTTHCGVELSMEKTRITHVRDGFEFLGFHLLLGIGQHGRYVPKIRVPRKALSNVERRLHEAMRWRPLQESGAARLVRGSAIVRGWSNYYKIAFNFSKAAYWLDHKALWIAVKALCRKFDISTAQCLRKYGRGRNQISINEKYVLKRAQDIPMTYRQDSRQPYEPGTGCYLDDVDWEAEVRRYEGRRPGSMDLKAFVLFRDGHRCRQCGTRVTHETSQADHIKPVSSFASYKQATTLNNLQTLCLECHKLKTYGS